MCTVLSESVRRKVLEHLKVMGKPRNEFPKFNTEKLAERIVYAVKEKKKKRA